MKREHEALTGTQKEETADHEVSARRCKAAGADNKVRNQPALQRFLT